MRTKLAASSMSWCLGRAAAPARRAWLGLSGRFLGRTASVGLGELRGDVRRCEYSDVHVMWEMLGGEDDAAWMHGGSGSGSASTTARMPAASAGKKQRRSRRAAADAAACSRLFSTCCAF